MSLTPGQILLVEDNPDDVLFMQQAFRKAKFPGTIQVARDGLEAIEYMVGKGSFADRGRFPVAGLVLLDLKLPKQSGLEVLAWIQERPDLARVPVLVVTSSADSSDIRRAYDLGALSYHVKPTSFHQLVRLAEEIRKFWLSLQEGEKQDPTPLPGALSKPGN